MILLIGPEAYSHFADELAEMHRLRYRVFKERLDWTVTTHGNQEIDNFDAHKPVYLLQCARDGGLVQGCVRLLPSTGPTMLRDAFGVLIDGHSVPAKSDVWESSRFALDVVHATSGAKTAMAAATYELFAGMIEFGLQRELSAIVTVTDVRMERLLRWATWPLQRIGEPRRIGSTMAIAGYLEISPEALLRIRRAGQLRRLVLWMPALPSNTRHDQSLHQLSTE